MSKEPVRILLMEDDAGQAHLFRKSMERAGYAVDHAPDGEQGLAMYDPAGYDLVATDHAMPVYDGLEVIRRLALRGPLPPIIMVTGTGNERVEVEAMKLGVVMMDLDHFKAFNDNFGHQAGDALLSALAHVITAGIRAEDIACRYGGEEFLLVLPGASLETTQERAENIRQAVTALQVKYQGGLLKSTTISLGVAIFPDHGHTAEEVIGAADAALYRAKQAGRDRVEIAVLTPPEASAP